MARKLRPGRPRAARHAAGLGRPRWRARAAPERPALTRGAARAPHAQPPHAPRARACADGGGARARAQLGAGVRAVQVRDHQKFEEWTSCFFLLRADGSVDDVSARKCIMRIFPAWAAARPTKFPGKARRPAPPAGLSGPAR